MPQVDNKYLDLEGLQALVDKHALVVHPQPTAANPAAVKVGTDSNGHVVLGDALTKADVGLGNVANKTITVTSTSVSDGTNTFNKYTHPTKTAVDASAKKVGYDSTGHVVLGDALTAADVGLGNVLNKAITVTGTSVSDGTNTFNKYTHPTATAHNAAAVKVGNDGLGHVTLGAAIVPSDIGAQVALVGSGTGQNIKTIAGNNILGSGDISLSDIGLSGAMHFKGVVSGSTLPATTNYNEGDVIILGGTGKEYVLALNGTNSAKNWNELGDESSHALKSTTITAGTGLTGGGDLSQNRTISLATYGTASNVAPVKVGADEYGRVIIGDQLTAAAASNGAHTHSVSGSLDIAANKVVTGLTPSSKNYSWSLNKGTSNANLSAVALRSDSQITYGNANYVATATNIWGLKTDTSGNLQTTTASKAIAGTAKNVASAGTAVVYGTADCKSGTTTVATRAASPTTVGNANYNVNATTVATGLSGTAYSAAYDSTNEKLTLTALSVTTTGIHEATSSSTSIYGCGDNATIQEAVAAPSEQKITPAVANGTITPYTFENITVPIAATAVTSFHQAAQSSATAYVCKEGTASVFNSNTTISVSNPSTGGTSLITAITPVKDAVSSAGTISGTAASDGAHTHTVNFDA